MTITRMRATLLFLLLLLAPTSVLAGEVRVATSSNHTLVIAPDGTVLCQGRNHLKQCGVPGDAGGVWVDTLTAVAGVPKGLAVAIGDADHSRDGVQRVPAVLTRFTLAAAGR